MNNELYGKSFEIPSDKLEGLQKYSSEPTIATLLRNGKITYSNIKKILHDMGNGELDNLGGNDFKSWLETTLRNGRDNSSGTKDARLEAGLSNSHLKSHEKKNSIVRPGKVHGDSLAKYNVDVMESLERINDLIKKII